MSKRLVTVAVPTYNRPNLLQRVLDNLLDQDYENFEVIVSDNATAGDEVEEVIKRFDGKFKKFRYFKQTKNVGALKNFFFLLEQAQGSYFMWLADDDEITPGYISYLVEMLDCDVSASSVSANWLLILEEGKCQLMPRREYKSNHWFLRAAKYIWRANDAFFYGLHRADYIRRAKFQGYWWPNQQVLTNWAYVFLFDQVLKGKILVADDWNVRYLNHSYVHKNYEINRGGLVNLLKGVLRRFNLYCLYLAKVFAAGYYVLFIPLMIVSILAFGRDLSMMLFTKVRFIAEGLVRGAAYKQK